MRRNPDTENVPAPAPSQTQGRPSREERARTPEEILLLEIQAEYREIQQVGITRPLIKQAAAVGLAALIHAAKRGNVKAAMYLVDRLMGTPEEPFNVRAAQMTEEEVREQLYAEFIALGNDPLTAREMVERAFNPPAELPDGSVIDTEGMSSYADE